MAINPAIRLAIKAISYSDVDMKKFYKVQRTLQTIKSPKINNRFYKMWDNKIVSGGREILTRIYEPKEKTRTQLLLFFHGGGWVTESVDTYNRVCVNLANHTGCRVMSVEYRLAPENPFPDGLDDCYAVAHNILSQPQLLGIETSDVVLIGDSAGGNFAAVISMVIRDIGEYNIKKQILIYPATYNIHDDTSPFDSVKKFGTDYLLTSRHICEYMDMYVTDKACLNTPYIAPLLAESFTGLPDTLVITAEFDPLRDEGEMYAQKINQAGGSAHVHRVHDAIHGFFALDARYAHVKEAYRVINAFLNKE
ncbi:MAG: alpha/beta hydrolase [Oscillospiraceae bacterium]|nr:alpha/beta hydrolase [Oscillospiraceae bacterium]